MSKTLKLFLLVFFLANNFYISAQINIGLKTGFNLSSTFGENIYWDGGTEYKYLPGFQFGITAKIPINFRLSLQAELLHSRKGWISERGLEKRHFKPNYIELPLLFGYNIERKYKFYVNTGPYFAFTYGGSHKTMIKRKTLSTSYVTTTKGKIKYNCTYTTISGDDICIRSDEINQYDVGLNFGAGIGRNLGSGILYFDLRYGIGFIDFYKLEYIERYYGLSEDYKKHRDKTLSISLIYFFKGGNKKIKTKESL